MLLLAYVMILLGTFPLDAFAQPSSPPSTPDTDSCQTLYSSSQAVPQGFGAAHNLFSTEKELLINAVSCTKGSLTAVVGSNSPNQYVYNRGYAWSGSRWNIFSLATSSSLVNSYWYRGSASAQLQAASAGTTYFVGYVCQQVSSVWKCGCRDDACKTSLWQIQGANGIVGGS